MPNILKLQYKTCLTCLIYTLLASFSSLGNTFYERRAEGWHWYEEKPKKEEQKETDLPTEPYAPDHAPKTMEAYQKFLLDVGDRAMMNPTKENVEYYITALKDSMGKASHFNDKWREVVMLNPDLDESIKYPSQHSARQIYKNNLSEKKRQILQNLSKDYGLYFFYQEGCPYCRNFAPVVKYFSQEFGWEVVAIANGNEVLPDFPNPIPNNGFAEQLGVKVYPALIAVNPKTKDMIPLAHGLTSYHGIAERAYLLTNRGKR